MKTIEGSTASQETAEIPVLHLFLCKPILDRFDNGGQRFDDASINIFIPKQQQTDCALDWRPHEPTASNKTLSLTGTLAAKQVVPQFAFVEEEEFKFYSCVHRIFRFSIVLNALNLFVSFCFVYVHWN